MRTALITTPKPPSTILAGAHSHVKAARDRARFMVDVVFEEAFARLVSLDELKAHKDGAVDRFDALFI